MLKQILFGLRTGMIPAERARELGRYAFIEWLSRLPGGSNFAAEAARAWRCARPYRRSDPAVGVFCDLLAESTRMPPRLLNLALPPPQRRGGAQARRRLVGRAPP